MARYLLSRKTQQQIRSELRALENRHWFDPQTAKVERESVDTVETDDPQQDQVAMGAQQGRSSIVQLMKLTLD